MGEEGEGRERPCTDGVSLVVHCSGHLPTTKTQSPSTTGPSAARVTRSEGGRGCGCGCGCECLKYSLYIYIYIYIYIPSPPLPVPSPSPFPPD